MMTGYINFILILLGFIGTARGILVGPVRLEGTRTYIDYRLSASDATSVIECPIKLQDKEELESVSWNFYEGENIVGRYFWRVSLGGEAQGRLTGKVNLERKDGNLELLELEYDLAGFYECSARTTEGTEAPASKWEVLIIDITSDPSSEEAVLRVKSSCDIQSTIKISTIYPEPTVHSGLYSDSLGGFLEEVAAVDWHKQKFSNGSVLYMHDNVIFEINEKTPHDVAFLNNVGVEKSDGTYIPLWSTNTLLPIFTDRGCPPIKAGAYQEIVYNNGNRRTCRGEYLPPIAGPLKATVQCVDGYKPTDSHGHQSMVLSCSTKSWEWGLSNDYPELSHIKCVAINSSLATSGSIILVLVSLLTLLFARH